MQRAQTVRTARAYASDAPGKQGAKVLPLIAGLGIAAGTGAYFFSRSSGPADATPLKAATDIISTFSEPAFAKLLPDKVSDPNHPRPFTLVIDLDKFLVCHLWDREHSKWRIAKRPGAELFLFYASQMYEVVVFSSLPQHEGDAIVKKLDPFGCVSYGLYRFATKHEKGRYLKDIYMLNRDPEKVLVMGHDTDGFSLHPEHHLPMRAWQGDAGDRTLEASVDFLEMLAFSRLKDVRPAIESNRGAVFPDDFEHRQEAAFERTRQETLAGLQKRSGSFVFRLFGLAPSTPKELPTYGERKAERLAMRRKEYEHIRGLMQKQLEAEMAKEKAFYAEHKMPLWELFSKGPPPPPPASG